MWRKRCTFHHCLGPDECGVGDNRNLGWDAPRYARCRSTLEPYKRMRWAPTAEFDRGFNGFQICILGIYINDVVYNDGTKMQIPQAVLTSYCWIFHTTEISRHHFHLSRNRPYSIEVRKGRMKLALLPGIFLNRRRYLNMLRMVTPLTDLQNILTCCSLLRGSGSTRKSCQRLISAWNLPYINMSEKWLWR